MKKSIITICAIETILVLAAVLVMTRLKMSNIIVFELLFFYGEN